MGSLISPQGRKMGRNKVIFGREGREWTSHGRYLLPWKQQLCNGQQRLVLLWPQWAILAPKKLCMGPTGQLSKKGTLGHQEEEAAGLK